MLLLQWNWYYSKYNENGLAYTKPVPKIRFLAPSLANGHALVLVENGGEYPPPSKLVIGDFF